MEFKLYIRWLIIRFSQFIFNPTGKGGQLSSCAPCLPVHVAPVFPGYVGSPGDSLVLCGMFFYCSHVCSALLHWAGHHHSWAWRRAQLHFADQSRLLLGIHNCHDGVEAVVQDHVVVGENLRVVNSFKGSGLWDWPMGMAFYQGLCSYADRHNLKHVKFCINVTRLIFQCSTLVLPRVLVSTLGIHSQVLCKTSWTHCVSGGTFVT